MDYRYHHRPRRWRRGFFFPFIFFFIFMGWPHSSVAMLASVLPFIILMAFWAIAWNRLVSYRQSQRPYQNDQFSSPQRGTESNYYYQQPYIPYQQGYQASRSSETFQEGERSSSSLQQEQSSQEYEQPQAQYPEQMPPMQ